MGEAADALARQYLGNWALRASLKAMFCSLAASFLAFFLYLGSVVSENVGQDLFLVCVNLVPVAAVTFIVCLVALMARRSWVLHVAMLVTLLTFLFVLLRAFAHIGDIKTRPDQIVLLALLVPGTIQIAMHWLVAWWMRRRMREGFR